MRFELTGLPYDLDALEPLISKKTLEFHYWRYHHTYLLILNRLIQGTKFKDLDLETIIKVADGPIYNYAAQVWNHTFYFDSLIPGNDSMIKGSFAEVVRTNFGSVSFFKNIFTEAVESFFGVGWVWLVLNQDGSIEIIQKFNAGNPLRIGLVPLLTCDVWEHAYYLDYQHKLGQYADAFWKLVNWDIIGKRYNDAIQYNRLCS